MTDWTELREFKAVALTDSFVLSWHVEGGGLLLDVDVCLAPDHPFYEKPRRPGSACIHPGLLVFPHVARLVPAGDDIDGDVPDAVVEALGHGRITGLRRTGEGRYELQGEFGTACIESDRPILRLGNWPR